MNVIIIDDESAVRNTLTALLGDGYPDLKILAQAASVEEGLEAIGRHHPDLVFLDVEMPDGTGFDLLKMIPDINFRVVFITGHQKYALDAIKVSALDYLLKPVDAGELKLAIEKARLVVNKEEEKIKLQALNENLQDRKILKRIILRTADALQLISVSEIIRAEADSNYTNFYLAGNRRIIVSRTIKEFESMLSGSGIIRVHQSHLVNIIFIDRFMKRDGGYLLLREGTKIPVSPNLKNQVIQSITDHLYE